MAVQKVAYDGHTLIDLTQDTAVESDVADGKYFHKSNGERVQGTSGKVIIQGSDTSAFLIRPTAGETLAPLDCDRKSVLKKLGNTVAVNQYAKEINSTNWVAEPNVTATFSDGVASFSSGTKNNGVKTLSDIAVAPNHKYLFSITAKAASAATIRLMFGGVAAPSITCNITSSYTTYIQTVTAGASAQGPAVYVFPSTDESLNINIDVKDVLVIDLTLWYGSNDRIPSDLLSNPENWGRYYAGSLAYAAGYLVSADGTVLKSIGRNV